jgi:hypothetical protein
LDRYYADHEAFYTGLQNLVLHLHRHFKQHYINFGALSYTSTFAQEDLIKCELTHPPFEIMLNPSAILSDVSSNKHGTRHFGDLITFYYCLDFALHSDNQVNILDENRDGPFDLHERYEALNDVFLMKQHGSLCGCGDITICVTVYRRCRIRSLVYHSLLYQRRQMSNSFFIQYQDARSSQHFGEISYFFRCGEQIFAVVQHYESKGRFSDEFRTSEYHGLLKVPVDIFFSVVSDAFHELMCVPLSLIGNHCVVLQSTRGLIVTPISRYDEHD